MKTEQFHSAFKLQGKSFKNSEELIAFSKQISLEVHSFLICWFNEKDFIEVKTSGSTGKPKTIQLQKKYMVNSAIATGKYFELSEKTTALLCMSVNYIAGKMMLVRALILGWHLDYVEASSNPLKNLEKQYDFTAMVPFQLHNSVEEIQKVKKIIVGGGSISKELLSKIQPLETEIFATYGMTETITHIAVKRLNNFSLCKQNTRHADLVSASHYVTLPNISISLDNRSCLVIDAPTISDEKIVTNDLVELVSKTEFKWLGRFDTVVNSGGMKLIPEQIEEKLVELFENSFFVAGIPDAVLGEKLILVVEKGKKKIDKTDLFKKMKLLQSLLKYEIPKEIYILNRFVETETKKINRKKTLEILTKTD